MNQFGTKFKADRAFALSAFYFSAVSFDLPKIVLIAGLLFLFPGFSLAADQISIKEYPNLAIKVSNPVNMMTLPRGKTFQVNTPYYVLQFFFSDRNMLGMLLKRNPDYPVHVRWCFFRDCEESPFDYKSVIAQAQSPPLAGGFFEIKYPPQIQYRFQGLEFSW